MKLQNSLYTVILKEEVESALRYIIRLDSNHLIYQAHFPDEPITPGVCIIQIAKELLEDILRCSLAVEKVKNVKFLSVISPVQTPQVTYVLNSIKTLDDSQTVSAQVQVVAGEVPMAKISFVCRKS